MQKIINIIGFVVIHSRLTAWEQNNLPIYWIHAINSPRLQWKRSIVTKHFQNSSSIWNSKIPETNCRLTWTIKFKRYGIPRIIEWSYHWVTVQNRVLEIQQEKRPEYVQLSPYEIQYVLFKTNTRI